MRWRRSTSCSSEAEYRKGRIVVAVGFAWVIVLMVQAPLLPLLKSQEPNAPGRFGKSRLRHDGQSLLVLLRNPAAAAAGGGVGAYRPA
jgi:hypothetical protein